MDAVRSIASIGRYLGDPTRAAMLAALLDGRAWTAGELAGFTGVTASTASTHLAKLNQANLIKIEKQGRHRYHVLANEQVAQALESLTSLALETKPRQHRYQKKMDPLHYARSCYDHLAGELSITFVNALVEQNLITDTGSEFDITQKGSDKFLNDLEIDVKELKSKRRVVCRKCLDYSERRHHLAGSLGSALFDYFLTQQWLKKDKTTRRVLVTATGCRKLKELFDVSADPSK